MGKTVLIVEDGESLRSQLSGALSDSKYSVIKASDGESAVQLFHQFQPDIALVDSTLENGNDFEISRKLRSYRNIPIIFMNGDNTEDEQLKAFASGADDYVPSPISSKVVKARIDAIFRRKDPEPTEKTKFKVGPLELDIYQHTFKVNGVDVPLTRIEFQIVKELITSPERAVSHQQLIKNVWGEWYSNTHMIESHVSRLRGKVRNNGGPIICEAIRGVGYRLGVK